MLYRVWLIWTNAQTFLSSHHVNAECISKPKSDAPERSRKLILNCQWYTQKGINYSFQIQNPSHSGSTNILYVISMQSEEIKPIHLKGNQPWIFTGMTDAETEVPILWPPDAKSWFTEKDPDAGKDGGQEEKGTTGDEMVGWHHWFNGHEFEQTRRCEG